MTKKQIYFGGGIVLLIAIIVIAIKYNALKYARAIVSTASEKIGQKEIGTNGGFSDKSFESDMKSIGWFAGAQWCAFFAKYVYLKSLSGKLKEKADQLMNGSSQMTFDNFKRDISGLFKVSSKPSPGSIVVWQSKNEPTTGHVGIVKSVSGTTFETIEGNKDDQVSSVTRSTVSIPTNWKLRGFISIA